MLTTCMRPDVRWCYCVNQILHYKQIGNEMRYWERWLPNTGWAYSPIIWAFVRGLRQLCDSVIPVPYLLHVLLYLPVYCLPISAVTEWITAPSLHLPNSLPTQFISSFLLNCLITESSEMPLLLISCCELLCNFSAQTLFNNWSSICLIC